MVRNEDERAQALRDMGAEVVIGICSISIRGIGYMPKYIVSSTNWDPAVTDLSH